MKFGALMKDIGAMRRFYGILSLLSKLTKRCILRITKDHFFFIIQSETWSVTQHLLVWAYIERDKFFDIYNLVGVSMHTTDTGEILKDEIMLEIVPEMMVSSLKCLKPASAKSIAQIKSLKIKLTDKMSPCLTFNVEMMIDPLVQTGNTLYSIWSQLRGFSTYLYGRKENLKAGKSSAANKFVPDHVMHDVPVTVIPKKDWDYYCKPPPQISTDVTFEMLNIKVFRIVVEKMKKLCSSLRVMVKADGSLMLHVEKIDVTVKTYFKDIHLIKKPDDADFEISVLVDTKRLSHFLTSDAYMQPHQIRCSIKKGELLHQSIKDDGFAFNYYLPALADI